MPVRITQAKNIEFALQILARLKSEGIQPKLVITGPPDPHDPADMEYYRSLLEVRRQLKVDDEACFVYESGPRSEQGYTIGLSIVRELYRVCDALFIPSHREGFGMPILEAGMIGMPIFSVDIPAAQEIGSGEVMCFSSNDPVEKVARMILAWASSSPTQILRQRVRRNFTWKSIFQHDMLPLLAGKEAM
jgi:glycosyltransferase involved in cell wall biosynthesis